MVLDIPAPERSFTLAMDDDAPILIRRHGNPASATRLYVSHGNGFATDGYFPFWGPLGDEFDLVVFDMRNHGRNPPSDPSRHTYPQMVRDLDRLLDGVERMLGPKRKVGVFHSMSARAAMKHAIELGWRWDALALFDPPNVPPPGHPLYPAAEAFELRLTEWAKARLARFADPAELEAEYAASRAHRKWVAGAHGLMARAVLRHDAAAGDWVLACPPALEAAIYKAALTLNLWPPASAFAGPVKLVGCDPAVERAPPPAHANRILGTEHGYDYATVPGTGHLLQIEEPAACRTILIDFLARHRLAG